MIRVYDQDHEHPYGLSTNDIYCRPHFHFVRWYKPIFCGWNIYGRTIFGTKLLATYDTLRTCRIVMAELRQHMKAGLNYDMPEEMDELEDILEEPEREVRDL